jgi:hypothetical protein
MSGPAEHFRGQLLQAAAHALAVGVTDAAALADALYERWYAPARGVVRQVLAPAEVVAHLRAADAAAGRFEGGWTVLAPAEAVALLGPPSSSWQVPAAGDRRARWVDPPDLLYEGGIGLRPAPGATVAVAARRDSLTEPFGWWTSFGTAWPDVPAPLVRLYWSVRPERLFRLVEAVTAGLDAEAPWALKCPLDLERCRRPDAVVLYLAADAWSRIRPSLQRVYRSARPSLGPEVPALTLALGPGLALAEDPGDESFGTARCRVVAGGIAPALAGGVTDQEALARAGEEALDAAGVSLAAPYLGPGSQGSYEWTTD